LLFISGCASGKSRKAKEKAGLIYASSSSIPSWVTEIPEEKEYYYFVGTGGDEESFDSGKKSALNDAISQVVGVIGVTVTSSSTYEERYFAEQYTTTISAELFTEGRAKVQDAEVKEIYYEEHRNPDGSTFFRVWVLVKYSKGEIEKEQARLREILALKYGEVKNLEEKAIGFQKERELSDAVISYLSASIAALDLEDGEIFFSRNITRASELLTQFRLEKIGEDQVGYIGNPLKSPLILKVYYLEEGREVPIPNVPIRFSYRIPKKDTAGYKYQVVNSVTDNKGFASFTVERVYEVSDVNTVDARIDLDPYIKGLKSAPDALQDRIKIFRDVQQQKKATFVFRSDTLARQIKTGVFFMQIDEDNTLFPKPVTAPAVYEILYEKRFSIRVIEINPGNLFDKPERVVIERLMESAGKGVERILFGYVRIIEYDMISGFHTAKAQASAILVDVNTGNSIKTWQIFKSATGSSRELVKINVFDEAGKSLGVIISNTMP
jgi:hypothetical protein